MNAREVIDLVGQAAQAGYATDVSIRTVHPRACGERTGNCAGGVVDFGSSPRLRGTRKLS